MKLPSTLRAVLAAFLLLPACAFGQQNYQPAKVTTLAGDTLRGYINDRGWDRNPRVISFKADLQAAEQLFHPLDIKGFSVSNERYAAAKVNIEVSPQDLDKLSPTPTPNLQADTVFLRALVSGTQSLYQYKKSNTSIYFYIQQGNSFDLLVYKRYKRPGEGPVEVKSNNTFQTQLELYLPDCPTTARQLKATSYFASSLQHVFADYYACTSRPVTFQLHRKNRNQLGILAGISRATLVFSDPTNSAYPTFDSYTHTGPTGGLYYNVPLPGSLGHFSINNDVIFTSFKGSGSRKDVVSTSQYSTTTFSLELAYLKLNTLLRFTQPVGAGAIFINAGVSNAYAMQLKSEKSVRQQFYSTERTTTSELFPGSRHYEQGLVAGIGASYKKVSAEARYETSNGFLVYEGFGSAVSRYSLLLGYRFH